MSTPLTAHEHPSGFTLGVPVGWLLELDPQPGIALVAADPADSGEPFATNHVVTVDDLMPAMDFRTWQLGSDHVLAGGLQGYQLIDLDRIRIGEREAVRRVASHHGYGHPVTMIQTAVLAGRRGFTLTSTVSTLSFPGQLEAIAAVAESLALSGDVA